MGRFAEGWEQARKQAEERDAAARRRANAITAGLKRLSDRLAEDSVELERQKITMQSEHGSLVLKRLRDPMAGVGFDPDTGGFKIHIYSEAGGKTEIEAKDVEECAFKLGEYAYSLKS